MTTVAADALRRVCVLAGVALLALVVGIELVRQPTLTRFITAGCIATCAFVAAAQWPERAVVATLLLLPFLAASRRILLEFTGWTPTDPLLLVAPGVLVVILVRLFVLERRKLILDRASRLALVVLALMLLQTANPRGGGLAAGAAALLFTVVPLSWFFVGRELATPRAMRTLFGGLVVVACLVAVYGLQQTWFGFSRWDMEWLRQSGYTALSVGGVTRAFGTFSSAAEYGNFLGVAIVIVFAFTLDRLPQFLPAVPLLAVAVFYESSRGIVVLTIFAVIVVIAARTGNMRRAVISVGVALSALTLAFTFGRSTLLREAASSSNPLVSHQLSGLADPFNRNTSTLTTHLTLFQNGFKAGVLDPLGHGTASTTLAGSQFGSSASGSTEIDVSNVFFSLGAVGGLAYLSLILTVLACALRTAVQRRDAVSLAALGTLVAVFGQWLNGGYYALSPVVWFTAGFVVAGQRSR